MEEKKYGFFCCSRYVVCTSLPLSVCMIVHVCMYSKCYGTRNNNNIKKQIKTRIHNDRVEFSVYKSQDSGHGGRHSQYTHYEFSFDYPVS